MYNSIYSIIILFSFKAVHDAISASSTAEHSSVLYVLSESSYFKVCFICVPRWRAPALIMIQCLVQLRVLHDLRGISNKSLCPVS